MRIARFPMVVAVVLAAGLGPIGLAQAHPPPWAGPPGRWGWRPGPPPPPPPGYVVVGPPPVYYVPPPPPPVVYSVPPVIVGPPVLSFGVTLPLR